jgi:hypothetical protein
VLRQTIQVFLHMVVQAASKTQSCKSKIYLNGRRHRQIDAKYYHLAKTYSVKEKNPILKQAYEILSENGMKYFKSILNDADNYTKTLLNDGSVSIHRRGTRQASARVLKIGERCQCPQRMSFTSMCVHEFVAGDCTFQKNLFSDRLIQRSAAVNVTMTKNKLHRSTAKLDDNYSQENDAETESSEDESIDDIPVSLEEIGSSDGGGDDDDMHGRRNARKSKETESSDDESMDNIPLSELMERTEIEEGLKNAREENGSEDLLLSQASRSRPQKIPRSSLLEVCSNLTAAAEASPEISIIVYSTLTSLLDLVRGGQRVLTFLLWNFCHVLPVCPVLLHNRLPGGWYTVEDRVPKERRQE